MTRLLPRPSRRTTLGVAVAAASAAVVAGCSPAQSTPAARASAGGTSAGATSPTTTPSAGGTGDRASAEADTPTAGARRPPTATGPTAAAAPTPARSTTAPVRATPTAAADARATLAFGGDVHFEGVARSGLNGDLGSAFGVIADADAGFVNLETAITDRGSPGPKEYVFRAPARAMTVLKAAGVDAVNIANNHGLDYGRVGFADTLAASRAAGLPLLGGGPDQQAAYTPWRKTLNGIRVAVFGATDVLDTYAVTTWPATATRPGLASAKVEQPLLDAVRAERARSDVVVTVLHWGVEQHVCPTARQQQLAADLAHAGASLVVGSHAHVVQPLRHVGGIPVFYGLGNFHFYAHGGPGVVSGVAVATIGPAGVVSTRWVPAQIRSGAPQLLSGSTARAASTQFARLCP